MKVALIAMGILALLALALFLEGRQKNVEETPHLGPSSLIRGIRRRAMVRAAREQQQRAMQLEGALLADAGADAASL